MVKRLAEVDRINRMSDSNSFIVEAGGSERRVTLDNVRQQLAKDMFAPTTYTLEQSSSPQFEVVNPLAAKTYVANMGGYNFRVAGGKVYAAKLMATDWNYFADGTPVDNVAKYETMVHTPRCYFKASGKTMNFGGMNPIAGGHYFDMPEWNGAYMMYVDGNGVAHSRPDVAPSHSRSMSQFWACAQKLGSDFGLVNYGFQCFIEALNQAVYGNLDTQANIGAGWQGNWELCRDVPMGLTRSLGDGTGKVLYYADAVGNQYPTKLFGFEDLWGKLWEFRSGIRFYMDGDTRMACVYSGNQVSNTADGRKFAILSTANGEFVKSKTLGEYWDSMAQAIGGSSNSFYADGFYASTGGQLLGVGGAASYGVRCGLSSASSSDGFSRSGANVGSRLAFYGSPILVSGSELITM